MRVHGTLHLSGAASRYRYLAIVLIVHILYAVLGDDLDVDALEVDRETSLQLLRAHAQDLKALLVGDVWVVVLV